VYLFIAFIIAYSQALYKKPKTITL